MVKGLLTSKKMFLLAGLSLLAVCALAPTALAQEADEEATAVVEESEETETSLGEAIRVLGLALGAAGAIGFSAFATARSQAAIGAGGTGAMAEKPELFSRVFILVALPETMVVLGFVLGIVIATQI